MDAKGILESPGGILGRNQEKSKGRSKEGLTGVLGVPGGT